MAAKVIDVPGIGPVTFTRLPRSKAIRITVRPAGVRVSLPRWSPYAIAVAFAQQHTAWIEEERQKLVRPLLKHGQKLGKLHTVQFQLQPLHAAGHVRVTPTQLIIPYHTTENIIDHQVQSRAEKGALRALKKEAAVLLPPRLHALAETHGHSYGTVSIKQLKRRWGSCDAKKNIVLNMFLMQLSWQQIDYVLCHELAHTKHMDHSPAFWQELERMLPDARMIARRVRRIQPALSPENVRGDSTPIL